MLGTLLYYSTYVDVINDFGDFDMFVFLKLMLPSDGLVIGPVFDINYIMDDFRSGKLLFTFIDFEE